MNRWVGIEILDVEDRRFDLEGRDSVFSRVSDFAYIPIDAEFRITSQAGGEFALPMARATRRMDPAYGPAEDVTVMVRGGGSMSRQINDFLMAGVGMAEKLLAVEVLTPEGNFSSYPPHKHDVFDPEANLRGGANHLRLMLDRFESLPLALAAYNAGPSRVRRWLPERTLEADLWVETIPFKETRNYVQAVLAYSTVFDRSLGKNTLMSSRMGDIKTNY